MPNLSKLSKAIPIEVKNLLEKLGRHIRIARLRRGLRLIDLAARVGVSRYVMSDIEKGKPTTAIAAYISTLWVLGLSGPVHSLADPDQDFEGKALESIHLPKTAAKRSRALDNDF